MTFKKGYKQTPEHTAKIRAKLLGRTKSAETRARIAASLRGRVASPETRAKLSAERRTRTMSPEARRKIAAWNTGRSRPDVSGPNSHFWKGGISAWTDRHEGVGYYWWKKRVHARDENTCRWCGRGGLHGRDRIADHIIPWKDAEDMRYEVWNGRTLCWDCESIHRSAQATRWAAERRRGRDA